MSDQINVELKYKPFDPTRDGDLVFDSDYVITVSRKDGRGVTDAEAKAALMALESGA